MQDLAELFAKRMAEPPKGTGGRQYKITNEMEWYIWTLYDHCVQKKIAADLGIGKDKVPEVYKRLQEQGGPKGEKPAWMK